MCVQSQLQIQSPSFALVELTLLGQSLEFLLEGKMWTWSRICVQTYQRLVDEYSGQMLNTVIGYYTLKWFIKEWTGMTLITVTYW